ncbi:phosphorylated adapter RNA export protein-like [Centruroides vittatus]|uniref:phosphorylated adapter RNA export protein-like n=1 Tax=Centruroides vittatus TaxID=120091 RepID=UPI00350F1202
MASANYRINSFENSESDSDDNNSINKSSRNDFSQVEKEYSGNLLENIHINNFNKKLNSEVDISDSVEQQNARRKRKKVNNIWSSVLQDQSLSDGFDICNVEHILKSKDRHCESYDYRRRELDTRPPVSPDLIKVDDDETFPVTENFEDDDTVFSNNKNKLQTKYNQHKLTPKEYKIAKLIVKKLRERKWRLIYNVVKILGVNKAMELLKKTEHIEKKGGMLVINKSRRRTPGGVFFHLIKSDHRISKEQCDEIFEEEERNFNFRKTKDHENQSEKNSKFHVLQCYSCKTYQVHQIKKINKWNCKICNEKQSVKQVYCRGTAADCREHTQKLNLLNGMKESIKNEGEMELVTETNDGTPTELQVPCTSKWSKFLSENEEEKMDDDTDLTSTHANKPIRKESRNICEDKEEELISNKNEDVLITDKNTKSLNSNSSVVSKWNEFI